MADNEKKGIKQTLKDSAKDVVPKTTGGKILLGISTVFVSAGSVIIDRFVMKHKKK